jgi:hypothetical protein
VSSEARRALDKAFAVRLAQLGFARRPRLPSSFRLPCNEGEFIFFPGVTQDQEGLVVDPVLAIEQKDVRQALERNPGPWQKTHAVCHAHLGMLDTWTRLRVSSAFEVGSVVDVCTRSLQKFLPVLAPLTTREGAVHLFKQDICHSAPQGLAILFAEEKLELLGVH